MERETLSCHLGVRLWLIYIHTRIDAVVSVMCLVLVPISMVIPSIQAQAHVVSSPPY